jgi:hypothetical protein
MAVLLSPSPLWETKKAKISRAAQQLISNQHTKDQNVKHIVHSTQKQAYYQVTQKKINVFLS